MEITNMALQQGGFDISKYLNDPQVMSLVQNPQFQQHIMQGMQGEQPPITSENDNVVPSKDIGDVLGYLGDAAVSPLVAGAQSLQAYDPNRSISDQSESSKLMIQALLGLTAGRGLAGPAEGEIGALGGKSSWTGAGGQTFGSKGGGRVLPPSEVHAIERNGGLTRMDSKPQDMTLNRTDVMGEVRPGAGAGTDMTSLPIRGGSVSSTGGKTTAPSVKYGGKNYSDTPFEEGLFNKPAMIDALEQKAGLKNGIPPVEDIADHVEATPIAAPSKSPIPNVSVDYSSMMGDVNGAKQLFSQPDAISRAFQLKNAGVDPSGIISSMKASTPSNAYGDYFNDLLSKLSSVSN